MGNLHKGQGGVKKSMGKSATVHKPAGSGSRPGKSAHKIETSAPAHAHKLGRATAGHLK